MEHFKWPSVDFIETGKLSEAISDIRVTH